MYVFSPPPSTIHLEIARGVMRRGVPLVGTLLSTAVIPRDPKSRLGLRRGGTSSFVKIELQSFVRANSEQSLLILKHRSVCIFKGKGGGNSILHAGFRRFFLELLSGTGIK